MPYKDKILQREYQRQWMEKRRLDFFIDKVCSHCGSNTNLTLDHIDPSKKLSHKIWSWSEERRNEELKKCQVLCDDCHKEKTREEGVNLEHGSCTMYRLGCRCYLCMRYIKIKVARRIKPNGYLYKP